MVATVRRRLLRRRRLGRAVGRRRLAPRLPALTRYASVASIVAGIVAAGARRVTGIRLSVSSFGVAAPRRSSSCTGGTSPPARGHRIVSTSAHGQCVRLCSSLVDLAAALWFAPGALAAGWCGAGEASVDRPDVVTGAQVHAVVATPADARRPVRRRREPARGRRRLDQRVVARSGPDAGAALRPGRRSRRVDLPRHLVRAPAAARERLHRRSSFERDLANALGTAGYGQCVQGLRRLLRRARGRGGRLRDRRRRLRPGPGSRSSGSTAAPTSRATVSRHTSCCTRSARSRPDANACTPARGELDRASVRFAERHPLSVRRRASRCRNRCSTSTTTTTTATAGSWNDIQDSLWLHRLNMPAGGADLSISGPGQ